MRYFLWIAVILCLLFSGKSFSENVMMPLYPGGLNTLPFLDNAETRSISAENPTGEKGKGGMAIPNPAEPKDQQPAAARAADDLGQGWKVRPFLRINAGKTTTLMDVDGPGIIQHIWLVEGLSRDHVLRFYWDGEETPSVEVPVPDFFAVGHERFARVNSLAVIANPSNALTCFWPMPFRKHARITLSNESTNATELVAFQINYQLTEVPENAAYFHAQWRRSNTKDQNPYVIVDNIKGKGRYVGTFLAWTQMEKGWFGEGEIKFFMDGDTEFPTICGTGTEDYFLGSYGFPQSYTTAYVGTTLPSDENAAPPQNWSLYRWHIPDPICFKEDLRVTIQALGWNDRGKYKKMADDICSVAYWYQEEPHTPFPTLPPAEARHPIHTMLQVKRGGIEGEDLTVQDKSAGQITLQNTGKNGVNWSDNKHLWWTEAKPGDTLTLSFPIEETGDYQVFAQFTKSYDYAIVEVALNGNVVVENLDLFSPDPMPGGETNLGQHSLSAGEHTLTIKILGKNEEAKPEYMFGLDYIRFEKTTPTQ